MALDEAKVEYAIGRSEVLEERLDTLIGAIESEREEMGRRFELHGEAIKQSNARVIKEEITALEARITERVNLLVQAQTAGQCSDIDSIKEDIDGIRIKVDAIDTRTRDYPLVKGKVEQLEARPGQFAIKAWQKVAAIAGGFMVMAASLLPWIFPRKG
jgi:hypothetical protein